MYHFYHDMLTTQFREHVEVQKSLLFKLNLLKLKQNRKYSGHGVALIPDFLSLQQKTQIIHSNSLPL